MDGRVVPKDRASENGPRKAPRTAVVYTRELPENASLSALARAAADCRACPLWLPATQVVFGEGRRTAPIVLAGEQPGNEEDLQGKPFVGPAGVLLDAAFREAGLQRSMLYLTNVVKHFKFRQPVPGKKKRIHQKPNAREVRACLPWFDAEWKALDAQVLVCLGATASQALIAPSFRITRSRGRVVESRYCNQTIATWHPSAILRAPESVDRRRKFAQLVDDLITARELLKRL
jgi:DNA polymerase